MLHVMGATAEASVRYQLSSESRSSVDGLAGAAQTFLGQLEGPGNIWDLWNRRDDVAAEFLAWHSIARLRLATAGLMPPVERP